MTGRGDWHPGQKPEDPDDTKEWEDSKTKPDNQKEEDPNETEAWESAKNNPSESASEKTD